MSADTQAAAPNLPRTSAGGAPASETARFFGMLARHRDIIIYRTLAGLKAETRQFYLGYLWFALEPAINTAILYVAFKNVLGRGTGSYVLFLLLGTLPWQWFESAVMAGMGGIKGKLHIMMHFDLPKALFPIVSVMTSTWRFCWVFLVLLAAVMLLGPAPTWHYVFLPTVFAAQFALITGLALLLAVAVVYVSDVTYLANSIFRILFFLSGIFFAADKVPADLLPWFYANPMASIIESYRRILLEGRAPDWVLLGYAGAVGLALCCAGHLICRRIDKTILKNVGA